MAHDPDSLPPPQNGRSEAAGDYPLSIPVPLGPMSGPFANDAVSSIPVVLDRSVEHGRMDPWPLTIRVSALDERVLLHELLHALIHLDPSHTVAHGSDEDLVRYLTRGLLLAGYRRTDEQSDLPCPMGGNPVSGTIRPPTNGSSLVLAAHERGVVDAAVARWRHQSTPSREYGTHAWMEEHAGLILEEEAAVAAYLAALEAAT